jgi:dTDP-4-dehydrorhamnose 3,5-epimerase
MKVTPAKIPDVLLIEPVVFKDDRGYFFETYQVHRYREAGIPPCTAQDNHTGSRQGVLRGLHYQIGKPQGKLVRVIVGEVFDVAVDLRRSSPTFGQSVGLRLSAENRRQVWIPPGFAHGFLVLSEFAEVLYKVDQVYAPECERTLLWNDPLVGVPWPLAQDQTPILSPKDQCGLFLEQVETYP